MTFKAIKLFNKIDTVSGHCEYCGYETILVAIVDEFYRCTHCGEDTKQYINGSIRYLKLTNEEKAWAKSQHSE
jgi:tRNA(Ile2) C34 agmatinyltransferase TiaS|tara:strand:- start:148 stop:366 length:219 start_codon:yes stop_codon:yes gene_type:complete